MEIVRHWRLQPQRYKLVGEICPQGHKIFPPRDICPDCGDGAKTPFQFSGQGEVYSFTIVYEAPENFTDFTPYAIGLIKLDEGPLVTARLTDVDNNKIKIGMPVEMVTRLLYKDGDKGPLVYGYNFRPPM